ncbi:MAG: F420-dependent methylenetetrahydromethanopterin dehydrogenase [Methanobacteriota archaeon]|nr:MAG: F420-dependent methylenetetrahydromethanopterin dehydrogenase [Euryarchaeota archaeon]
MLLVVAKTGNIGSSLVLDLLLDERADRKDIDVRVVSSGAKMSPAEADYVSKRVLELGPDLVLYATPNASAPGPRKVIEALRGRRAIVVSDGPAVKAKDFIEERGLGYILVKADAMIGARREFLDPTEMAVFNADILKVLAGTGVVRLMQVEIGKTLSGLKEGKVYLPRIIVSAEKAVEHAEYQDQKARENAMKAYKMAEEVGKLNVRGCFIEKDPDVYIRTVAEAHERLRQAAALVEEARLIEQQKDTLLRTPHSPDGRILRKTRLLEKPS